MQIVDVPRAAKRAGFEEEGGASRFGLVRPYSSFGVLRGAFGTFPIFPGIFPICPFPLSRSIQRACKEHSRKGLRHDQDLSRRKVGTFPDLECTRFTFSQRLIAFGRLSSQQSPACRDKASCGVTSDLCVLQGSLARWAHYCSIQNDYRKTFFLRAISSKYRYRIVLPEEWVCYRDRSVGMLAENLALQIYRCSLELQFISITDTEFGLEMSEFCKNFGYNGKHAQHVWAPFLRSRPYKFHLPGNLHVLLFHGTCLCHATPWSTNTTYSKNLK